MAGSLKEVCCKSPDPTHCDQVSTTCNKTAMFAGAMVPYVIAPIKVRCHIYTRRDMLSSHMRRDMLSSHAPPYAQL